MEQGLHHDVEHDADDDLMRQTVKRPTQLKGHSDEVRTMENKAAIGGMRYPRLSIGKVSGHKAVGKKAFKVISALILRDPKGTKEIITRGPPRRRSTPFATVSTSRLV